MDQFHMLPFANWESTFLPLSHTSKVTTEPVFSEHQGFGGHVQDYLINQHVSGDEPDLSQHTNNPAALGTVSPAKAMNTSQTVGTVSHTPTLNSLLNKKPLHDLGRKSGRGPELVTLSTQQKLLESLNKKKFVNNIVKSDTRKYRHHTYSKETSYKGLNLTGLCTCPPDLKDKEEVPDDQVFIDNGEMCRLQDVAVIKIGHLQMHAFMKNGNLFVPKSLILGHFSHDRQTRFKQAMWQYSDLKVVDMGDYDLKLIKQKYNLVISRSMQHMVDLDSVRMLANILLKEQDDPIMDILANKPFMLKMNFSNVRCSECRLKIAKPEDSDQYSILDLDSLKGEAPGDTEPEQVEVTIGEVTVHKTKFASFQMQDYTYISMKEFVSMEILSLGTLQRKFESLNYSPIITPPEIVKVYEESDMCVSKSLWMDLDMVVCVCKTCNLRMSKRHDLLIAFTMKNYSYTASLMLVATDTSGLHDRYSVDYETIEIDERLKGPLSGGSFEISNHPNPNFRRNNLFRISRQPRMQKGEMEYSTYLMQRDMSTESKRNDKNFSEEKPSEKESTSCSIMDETDTIMVQTGEEYIIEDIEAFRLAVSAGQVQYCHEGDLQTVKTVIVPTSSQEDACSEGIERDGDISDSSNRNSPTALYEENLPSSSVHLKETLQPLDSLDTYPAKTTRNESDVDDQPPCQLKSFNCRTSKRKQFIESNCEPKSTNQTHIAISCSIIEKSPVKSPSSINQTHVKTSVSSSDNGRYPVKSPSTTNQTHGEISSSDNGSYSVKRPSSKNQTHGEISSSSIERSPVNDPSPMKQTHVKTSSSKIGRSSVKRPSSMKQTYVKTSSSKIGRSSVKRPSSMKQTHVKTSSSEIGRSSVKDPSSMKQTHVKTSSSEIGRSPVNDPSSMKQTHVKTPSSKIGRSPVNDPSSMKQTHVKTSSSKIGRSSVKDPSSMKQTHVKTSSSEIGRSAVKDPTTMKKTHVKTSSSEIGRSPVNDPSSMEQTHVKTSSPKIGRSPVNDPSSMEQTHVKTSSPEIGRSAVNDPSSMEQTHVKTSSPEIGRSAVNDPSSMEQTHVKTFSPEIGRSAVNDPSSMEQTQVKQMTSNVQISPVKSPSRVDKMYSKIAAMMSPNSSDDYVTPLNMLATIATTEEAESDPEGDLGATMNENQDKLNSGRMQLEYSEEARRIVEEKVKKFVVFAAHGSGGIRVKRFKEGAEQAFPALFSPYPDHPVAKDLRKKFMISVCRWIQSKLCNDKDILVKNTDKFQDSALSKDDQIICTGNGRDKVTSENKQETNVMDDGHDKAKSAITVILKDKTKTTVGNKTNESHEVGNEISETSEDINAMAVTCVDGNETSVLVDRSRTEFRNLSVNKRSSEEVLKRKALAGTCRVRLKRMKILEDIFGN